MNTKELKFEFTKPEDCEKFKGMLTDLKGEIDGRSFKFTGIGDLTVQIVVQLSRADVLLGGSKIKPKTSLYDKYVITPKQEEKTFEFPFEETLTGIAMECNYKEPEQNLIVTLK